MADSMSFPDTVDEFMEQYKFVDTVHSYSDKTEYVPIFRMKQWFDHCKGNHTRTGRWEQKELSGLAVWKCGFCWKLALSKTPYCPNCGAKMDLEK